MFVSLKKASSPCAVRVKGFVAVLRPGLNRPVDVDVDFTGSIHRHFLERRLGGASGRRRFCGMATLDPCEGRWADRGAPSVLFRCP
jgi:hypothetical protein